jgi:acyl dehydratase
MPLNRACIGKQYSPTTVEVTVAAIEAYARACNETNPHYYDSDANGGIVAPPMFAAVVTWLPLVAAITDPEVGVDFLRLLHSKQEMEFLAPIRPGDRISAQARIEKIEAASSGESLVLEIMGANQDGIAVTQIRFSALIRTRRRASLRNDMGVEREQSRDAAMRVSEVVDPDQTSRYAEASGDRNPIHVDPAVAKMAGLPRVIVHGLCTMAFACRAIIDSTCGSDPMQLKRLAAEFSRPVFPGDSITTAVWPVGARDERRIYAFETVNRENVAVIRDGVAEVLP